METVTANWCKVGKSRRWWEYTVSWDCPNCGAVNEQSFDSKREEYDNPYMDFYANQTCSSCGETFEIYVEEPEVEE